MIHDLKTHTVPIEDLKLFPKNPRRGHVEKIAESLSVNGQYVPIVVNKRNNQVLRGNHTVKAAKSLDWDTIAVVYVDVPPKKAKKIVLADNKTSDSGQYDNRELANFLESLKGDLDGTAYDDAEMNRILLAVESAGKEAADAAKEWTNMPGFEQEDMESAYSCTVHFETLDDAKKFFKLIGRRKSKSLWWPEESTHVGSNVKEEYVSA